MIRYLPCLLATVCALTSLPAAAIEFDPAGRLHVDHASHHADREPLDNGMLVRRARLGLEIKFNDDWKFETDYDFADVYTMTDEGTVRDGRFKDGFGDAVVTYDGWDGADIDIGQFKLPFGLENGGSSNDTPMIERALPTDALIPSRRRGIGLTRNRDHYTLAVMAFDGSISDPDDSRGFATRATWAPIRTDDTVFHLGASLVTAEPGREVDIDTRPESRPTDEKFVNTGKIKHVDHINRVGLEAAWRKGPLSLQAEWMNTALERGAGHDDVNLNGWYVMGSWILTGQMREYDNGEFKGLSDIGSGGAWELAARYSSIDLDDGTVRGGRERNLSFGVNYYLNKHVRIMANYINVHSKRHGKHDDPDIFLTRLQLVF